MRAAFYRYSLAVNLVLDGIIICGKQAYNRSVVYLTTDYSRDKGESQFVLVCNYNSVQQQVGHTDVLDSDASASFKI